MVWGFAAGAFASDGGGYGTMSFAYPSTIYTGTFHDAIEQARRGGSQTQPVRLRFNSDIYFPTLAAKVDLGPSFNLYVDPAVNDGTFFRGMVGAAAVYFFNPERRNGFSLRAGLGPDYMAGTGSLSSAGHDWGAGLVLGGGYELSRDVQLTADYSSHLGGTVAHTFTMGFSASLWHFEWKSLLWWPLLFLPRSNGLENPSGGIPVRR